MPPAIATRRRLANLPRLIGHAGELTASVCLVRRFGFEEKKGVLDRTLHFIESGTSVRTARAKTSRLRMALINAGTVVGEGRFFFHLPRKCILYVSSRCKFWCIKAMRSAKLSNCLWALERKLTLDRQGVLAKRL